MYELQKKMGCIYKIRQVFYIYVLMKIVELSKSRGILVNPGF